MKQCELKAIYDIAKNEAKKAVAKAKSEESEEFGRMVESEEGRQNSEEEKWALVSCGSL